MTNPIPRISQALEGRYTVEREIGHGGMAMVYLATDVKHDRKVALKVLRPELAAVIGAERFLAEIKTTASLQHPHILPLHDSGEADGTVFYVMPYVQGESLRDRLQRDKQLPVDEALRIAREIASALGYAHRHGIVHRDIKPENILLHDGQALVADFGIALAVSRSDGATRMTETGMSLGTPHYMAPEQAMGDREITPKADIYALACVLYEMLTGDPPFTGSTAQAIVARTLTEQPRSVVLQRHTVPEHVEHAIITGLEKLPADRFATAEEFIAALDGTATVRKTASATSAHAATKSTDWRAKFALPAITVAIVAIALLAWFALKPSAPNPVSRYIVQMPAGHDDQAARGIVVSPDGSMLAYLGPADSGSFQLWIKRRDRERASPIAGTNNATSFTFSPNSESIAFLQSNGLVKKIPVLGGAAIPLADGAAPARGIAWLDDGSILYPTPASPASFLMRITEDGGTATSVLKSDTTGIWYPRPLPGSHGVLFINCGGGTNCPSVSDLSVLDLRSGAFHSVASGAVAGVYIHTGHVVYVRPDGGMLRIAFDPKSLKTKGSPAPIRDSIALGANRLPLFDVSNEGTMFARTGANLAAIATFDVLWVDRAGHENAIDSSFTFRIPVFGGNAGWSLSPDGTRLAIGRNTEAGDNIWVKQLTKGGSLTRVTFDSAVNFRPRWMRDGKQLMYISRRMNMGMLYRRPADGTGNEQLMVRPGGIGMYEAVLTPDEQTAIIRTGGTLGVVGARDIAVAHLTGDSAIKPLIATKFDESGMTLSPDGRWLAYESNETGKFEVYIQPFPNVGSGKWQVSTDGGRAPLWSRNGRELFYVNAIRELYSVPVGLGATPNTGTRQLLFKLRDEYYLTAQENYTPFDVASDGRFIMARRLRATAAQIPVLGVTENWFEELKKTK